MKVIGITGPIGSGKSTASAYIKEQGAVIIDADVIAREVVKPGKPAWQEIVDRFGDAILAESREIKRRELGRIVFNDPDALAFVNGAIHPRVAEEIAAQLNAIEEEYGDGKVVVLDVPLLIEVGLHEKCDVTVIITADREIRKERLMKQGLSEREAEERIDVQHGKERLERLADIVISNNGSESDLREKIKDFWNRFVVN